MFLNSKKWLVIVYGRLFIALRASMTSLCLQSTQGFPKLAPK